MSRCVVLIPILKLFVLNLFPIQSHSHHYFYSTECKFIEDTRISAIMDSKLYLIRLKWNNGTRSVSCRLCNTTRLKDKFFHYVDTCTFSEPVIENVNV